MLSDTGEIMIFCIVLGDAIGNSFPVDVSKDMTVGHLKELIKKKNEPHFNYISAKELNLWSVNIPTEDEDLETKIYAENIKEQYQGIMLSPFKTVGEYFHESTSNIRIIVQPPPPATTVTTLAAVLSSQQPISPFRRNFKHKFYGREQAINEIARIANMNYTNLSSTYHRDHYFILVPGGSGIGKSRMGMESQHLISHAEETVLMDIGPGRIDLVRAALNDPCYIFIDFNEGCKYLQKLDKMDSASVRIGARIAVASGIAGKALEKLPEESLNLYRLDDVMQEILHRRFRTTHRPLEAVIIHIDEYQLYIDDVQRKNRVSWEDARKFFKDMLNEIGSFMSNQEMHKSELEFFIIPICTGTSAIDIHFLHTEYNKVLVRLKPLSYSPALQMFFDKYDPDHKQTEICNFVSKQEHFRIALFDTGFVPKFLSDFLTPEFITPKIDWGNNLYYRMMAESVKVDSNNSGHWKSIEDIHTIISFGLTRQIVERDFLLPSNTSIGDIERDGLIFLAVPEKYPDDKFIIIVPFMSLKILNQMLLPHSFFPDELLLISTIDRPWRWQDFECLHGYYQKALIEALINVKKARIRYLKKINDSNRLVVEEQKNWCLSDIFRGAKGNANLLKRQVKLRRLDVFTEKNKLLVKTTDIAEFKRSVLCKDESLETAIFHCADECANIDRRWVLESTSNKKPLAIFMQDKYSDLDTNDPTVSGPDLKCWYDKTLQSVSSYSNDYDMVLVFFTVRRFTGSNLWQMPRLLLIDYECIAEYLSPTFAHRGLVSPPDNYDLERVLSCPISDESMY